MALLDLHALATMIPPGYRLTFALENVGAGGAGVVTSSALPAVATATSQPERALENATTDAPVAPARDTEGDPLDADTPLGLARRFAAAEPTMELTASEWAKKLGYSARELTKARRTPGALPYRKRGKGAGKSGRGLVIKARDVERFLQTMRDAAIGLAEPPAWFDKVVDKRKV